MINLSDPSVCSFGNEWSWRFWAFSFFYHVDWAVLVIYQLCGYDKCLCEWCKCPDPAQDWRLGFWLCAVLPVEMSHCIPWGIISFCEEEAETHEGHRFCLLMYFRGWNDKETQTSQVKGLIFYSSLELFLDWTMLLQLFLKLFCSKNVAKKLVHCLE